MGERKPEGAAPSADEHADRVRRRLDHSRDTHDRRAEDDCSPTTEAVRHVGRERVRCEASDVLWERERGEWGLGETERDGGRRTWIALRRPSC